MPFFRNMVIMKHVHHLNTEIEGKKTYHIPKYTPIVTNQVNATNIIDEWQVINGYFSRFNQLLPKMQLGSMAELGKRKKKLIPRCHFVVGEFNITWHHLILF